MVSNSRKFLWVAVLTVTTTVGLFWVGYDCQLHRLYAPFPYHRLQVDAYLEGRLSLSSSIEQMDHGLTWHDNQVNQVWGLGVPLWMLPFELVYRLFGERFFPDRIALLVALSLVALYACWGGVLLGRYLRLSITGYSFITLTVLFPPLWNLILGRQAIFEDTILYACLTSIALLVGVIRFLLFGSRLDFWIVCILGGASGLIRVTHGIYGLVGGLLCGFVMIKSAIGMTGRGKPTPSCAWVKIGEALIGCTILLGGFVFLAWSNNIRFGSLLECGHRMTNHYGDVVYLTRFANPFESASLIDASRELFSWIFLGPFHRNGSGWEQLLPWQASAMRWRGVDQPTFDPSYLLISVLGCMAGTAFLFRRARRQGCKFFHRYSRFQSVVVAMLIWFIICVLALSAFYAHVPILATRYILDFAPCFLAPFVLVLLLFSRRWPRLVPILLGAWICMESAAIWSHWSGKTPTATVSRGELLGLPVQHTGKRLELFHGKYSVANHPAETGIKYNGSGWRRDGVSEPIVTLALDQPQFIELSIGSRQDGHGSDRYRAKVGNLELPIESLQTIRDGERKITKIKFRIPDHIRRRAADELIFLCFANDMDDPKLYSERPLYEVIWK